MSLYEFCSRWHRFAIYGAGVWGRDIFCFLQNNNIASICYIVTKIDNNGDSIDGIPILSLDDFVKSDYQKDTGIIVAVSKRYRHDIVDQLKQKGIMDYYYCEALLSEKQDFEREFRPLKPSEFLVNPEPCNRHFGFQRGKPIDRYYIENFLDKESKKIGEVERVLEVGADTYSNRYFPSALAKDIVDHKNGWDLTNVSTLPQDRYDVFICTQTFNFIYDVKASLRGSYYLLKTGGILLATVAGNISQICVNDNYTHYWNFTAKCIKNLMAEVFGEDNVQVFPFGNVLAATGFIQGVALEELPQIELLDEKNDGVYSIVIGIVAKKI